MEYQTATWDEVTLAAGEILFRRKRQTGEMCSVMVGVFRHLLDSRPEGWRSHLNVEGAVVDVEVTCGLDGMAVTFTDAAGDVVAIAGYMAGPDGGMARKLQEVTISLFHGTQFEPGFDVLTEKARPLLASIIVPRSLDRKVMGLAGHAASCLAGSALFTHGDSH